MSPSAQSEQLCLRPVSLRVCRSVVVAGLEVCSARAEPPLLTVGVLGSLSGWPGWRWGGAGPLSLVPPSCLPRSGLESRERLFLGRPLCTLGHGGGAVSLAPSPPGVLVGCEMPFLVRSRGCSCRGMLQAFLGLRTATGLDLQTCERCVGADVSSFPFSTQVLLGFRNR